MILAMKHRGRPFRGGPAPLSRSAGGVDAFYRKSTAYCGTTKGVIAISDLCQRRGDRPEHAQPVCVAEQCLGAALRMRHHAQDVAAGVADAGDGARRAVRVRLARDEPLGITVSKDDPPVALELIKRRFIGEVVSLAMCDRHAQ